MVTIYVLKLEKNKYYVGKTNDSKERIKSHMNNLGSEYTKKYKPIGIEQIINSCDDYDEDKYVRIYMDKYGIDNVRGGTFCNEHLTQAEKGMLQKSYKNTNNLCFICNERGHFANQCSKNSKNILINEKKKLEEKIYELNKHIEIIKSKNNSKIKKIILENKALNNQIKKKEIDDKIKFNSMVIDYEYELLECDKEINNKNNQIFLLQQLLSENIKNTTIDDNIEIGDVVNEMVNEEINKKIDIEAEVGDTEKNNEIDLRCSKQNTLLSNIIVQITLLIILSFVGITIYYSSANFDSIKDIYNYAPSTQLQLRAI